MSYSHEYIWYGVTVVVKKEERMNEIGKLVTCE